MPRDSLAILVVDDDPVLRTGLKAAVRADGLGARVDEAATGREGLALAQQVHYDALVLDHRLGDTTGIEVLKRLNEAGVEVPVVFCTGFGEVDLAVRAMKLGAADFVSKGDAHFPRVVQALRDVLGVPRPGVEGQVAWPDVPAADGRGPDAHVGPGEVIGGRYRVEAVLNQGASGFALSAHDERLERPVVVKVLRTRRGVTEEAVRAFLHEAKLFARMEHPNVLRVYDFGYWRDTPYLVMERGRDESLRDRMRTSGRLPAKEAVAIMHDVLSGLDHLHRHGILHRDLKPANVVRGQDGRWKLGDFGIAIHVDELRKVGRLAPPETRLGTPGFMSPEAVRGGELTPASDVYSAGAMLYLVVDGRPYLPFEGLSAVDIRRMIETQPPRPIGRRLPAALRQVVAKALAKDPGDRFEDAGAFLQALERPTARSR